MKAYISVCANRAPLLATLLAEPRIWNVQSLQFVVRVITPFANANNRLRGGGAGGGRGGGGGDSNESCSSSPPELSKRIRVTLFLADTKKLKVGP